MPRPLQGKLFQARHFTWRVIQRDKQTFYADGRLSGQSLGRYSLATDDRQEAIKNLHALDHDLAVQKGLIPPDATAPVVASLLLDDGWKAYTKYLDRSPVQGGSASGLKRYKPIFEKFKEFAAGRGVTTWTQVDDPMVAAYGQWLERNDYAYRTQYTELTVIKQIVKYLAAARLLPEGHRLVCKLKKPTGTNTVCYQQEQVCQMIDLCASQPKLAWLGDVIRCLAFTGLRIGELAQMRWNHISLEKRQITLPDHSRQGSRSQHTAGPTTKSHRTRVLPIHDELLAMLIQRKTKITSKTADAFVFRGPLGGALKPDTVRNILLREVISPLAELHASDPEWAEFRRGRVHSFRHYFCSICAASGKVSAEVLKNWLGHADSKMVHHYFHLHDRTSQRLINAVDFLGIQPESASHAEPA